MSLKEITCIKCNFQWKLPIHVPGTIKLVQMYLSKISFKVLQNKVQTFDLTSIICYTNQISSPESQNNKTYD